VHFAKVLPQSSKSGSENSFLGEKTENEAKYFAKTFAKSAGFRAKFDLRKS